jgi:hypothetical protein
MAMTDDTFVFPALLAAAQCLSEQITAAGVPVPEFIGIVPGDALLPDYCAGGMAWVRLASMGEWVEGSGDGQDRWSACTGPLIASIEMGIVRCAPEGSTANGEFCPPTMAEQLDATRLQMADQALMLRAIRCCLPAASDGRYARRIAVTGYSPVGPAGQCLGGRWTFDLTSV